MSERALREVRRDIGMIFQQFNLVPRLDVVTNVMLGRLNGHSALASAFNVFGEADIRAALGHLERLGIEGHALKRAEALSGGQQQRVAIARALMQNPKFVLADEPTGNLDGDTGGQVMDILFDLHDRSGTTLLLISHDMQLAHRCGRIVRLAETAFGHLSPILQNPRAGAVWQGREVRRVKKLEQAHFALALEGPGYLSDDYYAAQIFSAALGGGMSSRLFQKIREERGLCYTIFAQSGFHDDTGMMTIYAGTGGGDIADLAMLTIDEVRRAAGDISEIEVARAKLTREQAVEGIREADLTGHLGNGNGGPERPSSAPIASDSARPQDEDYQLGQALNLLKGLNLTRGQ